MGLFDRVRRKRSARPRVFILGLDGSPHGLMQDLFARGVLKNLAEIAGKGSLFKMSTTVPEVSSVAWTTFMTGVNPGRHGVFGFVDLKPGTYTNYFPNSTHVRSPCLWHILGKSGKRSVIVNMPSTYPAQELNGALIAGFVAIDLERATYPRSLVPWLKQIGYRLDVDAAKARTDKDAFLEDLNTSLEKREMAFHKLMLEEPWDLFAAVVTGTDRLHHFLWDAYEDPDSPHHGAFLDYYRKIDAMVGRLYDSLAGEDTFLALSDHGFGRLRRDVYINRWFEEQGYLTFSSDKRESIADMDPEKSRAFCLDPGRIYLNVKRRFPGGSVLPGKPYEALRAELAERLGELSSQADGGPSEPVLQRVYRKEEIYRGPFLAGAPDLILLARPGNNLRGATGRANLFDEQGPFTGMHTQDDAFFLCDRPIPSVEDLHILDVAKTATGLLDPNAAEAIEGRSLLADPGLS
jgi:predicted AlkP superfamily phosphohydrolase/phosphomutase